MNSAEVLQAVVLADELVAAGAVRGALTLVADAHGARISVLTADDLGDALELLGAPRMETWVDRETGARGEVATWARLGTRLMCEQWRPATGG